MKDRVAASHIENQDFKKRICDLEAQLQSATDEAARALLEQREQSGITAAELKENIIKLKSFNSDRCCEIEQLNIKIKPCQLGAF